MKKNTTNTFLTITAGFFVFAIALTLGRSALAQTIEGTSLETQISNLASTLEKVFLEEKDTGSSVVMSYSTPSGVPNPTCMDNYNSWNHSTTYLADAAWNLDFMPREIQASGESKSLYINEQFVDLNGDGLADYIYKYNIIFGDSVTKVDDTCVYLNNGSGFDEVYKCHSYVDSYGQDYYGDCADMS